MYKDLNIEPRAKGILFFLQKAAHKQRSPICTVLNDALFRFDSDFWDRFLELLEFMLFLGPYLLSRGPNNPIDVAMNSNSMQLILDRVTF